MIKNFIRKSFFIGLKIIAGIIVVLSLFMLWIYTGPRSLPFLPGYISSTFTEILPEGISVKFDDVVLGFNHDKHIAIKIVNATISDSSRGDLDISEIWLKIDLLAFLPQSSHNLLNIELSQPTIKISSLLATTKTPHTDDLGMIQTINDYVEKYKEKILKFSLSLTNTSVLLDFQEDAQSYIVINDLSLAPTERDGKLLFTLYGDFSIGNKSSTIEAEIDINNGKFVLAHGGISNISNSMLKELGFEIKELDTSHIEFDASFDLKTTSIRNLETLNFELNNLEGIIKKSKFFPQDLVPQYFKVKGVCKDNCSTINVNLFDLRTSDVKITSKFALQFKNIKTLVGEFTVIGIPVNKLQNYWPLTIAPRTRDWIFTNIKNGTLDRGHGDFNFDLDRVLNKKILEPNDLKVRLELSGTSMKYLEGVPEVTDINAMLWMNGKDINFEVMHGIISKTQLSNVKGVVADLGSSKSRVVAKGNAKGGLQDMIDLTFMYAEVKNDKYKNFTGAADAVVEIALPIKEEALTFNDIDITASAVVKNVNAKKVYQDFGINNGEFTVNFKDKNAIIKGKGLVNNQVATDFNVTFNLRSSIQRSIVTANLKWDDVQKLGFSRPDYLYDAFAASVEVVESLEGDASKDTTTFNVDLTGTNINFEGFGINKLVGVPADVSFKLRDSGKNFDVTYFKINFPNLISEGTAKVSKDLKTFYNAASKHTRFGNGNFGFDYALKNNSHVVKIFGDSFDISSINKSKFTGTEKSQTASTTQSPKMGLEITSSIKTLYMHDGLIMNSPEIKVLCTPERCQVLRFKGVFPNQSSMDFDYNYPKLKLTSDDAGYFLNGFGITNKIVKGTIDFSGIYNQANKFEGNLFMLNFQVRKAPILAKILSVASLTLTSFESLEVLLGGKGIKFDRFVCPVTFQNSVATLNECNAKGSLMALSGSGDVSFANNLIDIKGVVIPENIINKALKNLPILSSIFGGKNENEALGVNFKVHGSADDPEVTANPLSILAPGFLRKILQ